MVDKFTSVGESLSEQFRSLKDNHRAVLDWWQKRETELLYAYQGVSHTLLKAMANNKQLEKQINELTETCERLAIERDEANATIGQLQSDLLAFSERLDRLADWANKQRGVEK